MPSNEKSDPFRIVQYFNRGRSVARSHARFNEPKWPHHRLFLSWPNALRGIGSSEKRDGTCGRRGIEGSPERPIAAKAVDYEAPAAARSVGRAVFGSATGNPMTRVGAFLCVLCVLCGPVYLFSWVSWVSWVSWFRGSWFVVCG